MRCLEPMRTSSESVALSRDYGPYKRVGTAPRVLRPSRGPHGARCLTIRGSALSIRWRCRRAKAPSSRSRAQREPAR